MLINLGEAYLVVNLLPEGLDEMGPHHTLRLKVFGGACQGEIYEFNAEKYADGKSILIGRTPECDIKINDKLLSKIQSSIKIHFNEDGSYQWFIHDGIGGKCRRYKYNRCICLGFFYSLSN